MIITAADDERISIILEMMAGTRLLHNWWQDPTVTETRMITRLFLRRPDGTETEVSGKAQHDLRRWGKVSFPASQVDDVVIGGLRYRLFEAECTLTEEGRAQAAWIEPGFTTFGHLISNWTPKYVRKLEAAAVNRHFKGVLEGLQPKLGGRIRDGRFWFGGPEGLRKPEYGNYFKQAIPDAVMAKLAPLLEPFADTDGEQSFRLAQPSLKMTDFGPRRCETNIAAPSGECLACNADQGVACRSMEGHA